MVKIDLYPTLCPSFPHFERFATDTRLSGIRFNSAQIDNFELDKELEALKKLGRVVPIYFDVKGRQLRVVKVDFNPNYLDLTLNHAISLDNPNGVGVYFKAENDFAVLDRLEESGRRLIFKPGSISWKIKKGESVHILDPSLKVLPPMFIDEEKEKIKKIVKFGFKKFYLSYVCDQAYVDEFLKLVGKDAEVWLKIEDLAGLNYVANEFVKRPNLTLVAARGDLHVELIKPHLMAKALELIISKDPEACVGSRIMLSVIPSPGWREQEMVKNIRKMLGADPGGTSVDMIDSERLRKIVTPDLNRIWPPQVPACADFLELAWLYDIGYRKMLLCDELCLKQNLLEYAINAVESFARDYRPGKRRKRR
ncbi:MAG: hypothetical protein HY226_05435 [Candidatus Vogelbacteria bacterium]|nr:hypothetical protein [Candidatus Vogelbacteria bacterium]